MLCSINKFIFACVVTLLVSLNFHETYDIPNQSGSFVTITSGNSIRLRANKLRRPEQCRESLPRKSDELPSLTIVGRVKEVYSPLVTSSITKVTLINNDQNTTTTSTEVDEGPSLNAIVQIIRVIKGNQEFEDSEIVVTGFNSTSAKPCPNYVKPNDTLILLLELDSNSRSYKIHNGNMLSMNLNNLDKINALAADELQKRRGTIGDILCESHYCAYGRCKIAESGTSVSCDCPTTCEPIQNPVCSSNNVTYTNECELVRDGCRLKKPMFVVKAKSCTE